MKFITKLFTDPEKIEDSSIQVDLEIQDKTKTDLFNESVQEVLVSKLVEGFYTELVESCYDDEVVKQTKEAMDAGYRYSIDYDKYPKANIRYGNGGGKFYGLEFNLTKFLTDLVKQELSNEKD